MDAGPLTAPQSPPKWRLADPVAAATQGFVVSGFKALPTGRALFLEFKWPGDKGPDGWLNRLLALAPITSARPDHAKVQTRAASIAFSGTGLRRMGLPDGALASFMPSFTEGMFQEDRLRRLGDRREGQWLGSVVEGGPLWSANTPLRAPTSSLPDGFEAPAVFPAEQHISTAITVHALLLLYAKDEPAADAWATQVQSQLLLDGVAEVRRLELLLDVENGGFSREHFGFADALSQPLPYDEGNAVLVGGQPAKQDPVQGVPLGEFMFGHINGHQEKAPGPVVGESDAARNAGLPASENAEGFRDLGLNGSYLVVRELRQDVAGFWRSMDAAAASLRARDPAHMQDVTGAWLAERVMGRDKNGHLLCPGNVKLPACAGGNTPDSSFLFFDRDAQGTGCPPGSHVRRAFPRDALAPNPADRDTLLQAANNHRILRRGRKFGTKLADPSQDDGADRGLLFMCLNTDIDRQFEFVQQTWLLNSSFATLFQEMDPLVGPAGPMTIRDAPLRRTVNLDTFVRMAGGDYFFLPGLPALQFLTSL